MTLQRKRPDSTLDRLDASLEKLKDRHHLGPYAKQLAQRKEKELAAEILIRVRKEYT